MVLPWLENVSGRSTSLRTSSGWALSVATSGNFRDHPKVADAASELLQDVFERARNPCRPVYGVASLPLGTPAELEVIFEVAA
jgi:enamine deaminase RidA (YjgF/YER057c/UK114 family)